MIKVYLHITYYINQANFSPYFQLGSEKLNHLYTKGGADEFNLIPRHLYLLPSNTREPFFKVEHLNSFKVSKGQLLAKIPKDQFVDGCNTIHITLIYSYCLKLVHCLFDCFNVFIFVLIGSLKYLIKSLSSNRDYYNGILMLNICFFINLFPFIPTGVFIIIIYLLFIFFQLVFIMY